MNVSPLLAVLVPPDVVTNTFHGPALAPPPVTAVIPVGDPTLPLVAAIALDPPFVLRLILTVAPVTKPDPVTVMAVPPVNGPDLGLTAETVGLTPVTVTFWGIPKAAPYVSRPPPGP